MIETNITYSLYCIEICNNQEGQIVGRFFCDDGHYAEAYITEQLKEIYNNVKLTSAFLERLEVKINLILYDRRERKITTKVDFKNDEYCCILVTPLKEIYQPLTILDDGIKIGSNKQLFPNVRITCVVFKEGKIFLKCYPVFDNKKHVLEFDEVNITSEFNAIYHNKEIRHSLGLKKWFTKRKFANELLSLLKGKLLEFGYDEIHGISLKAGLIYYINSIQ